MAPSRTVALIGFMGVGKTTVGRALAQRLGLPFVDLDARIEAFAGPIQGIFTRGGEDAFRAIEAAALDAALAGPPVVLACGGGAPCHGDAMDRLVRQATVVFLDAPFSALAERLGGDKQRPLWGAGAEALYAKRRPVYARAQLCVDATEAPEPLAERIAVAVEAAWTG